MEYDEVSSGNVARVFTLTSTSYSGGFSFDVSHETFESNWAHNFK